MRQFLRVLYFSGSAILGLAAQNAPALADGTNKIYAIAVCYQDSCELVNFNGSGQRPYSTLEACDRDRRSMFRDPALGQDDPEKLWPHTTIVNPKAPYTFECVSMDVPVWTRR